MVSVSAGSACFLSCSGLPTNLKTGQWIFFWEGWGSLPYIFLRQLQDIHLFFLWKTKKWENLKTAADAMQCNLLDGQSFAAAGPAPSTMNLATLGRRWHSGKILGGRNKLLGTDPAKVPEVPWSGYLWVRKKPEVFLGSRTRSAIYSSCPTSPAGLICSPLHR